MVTGVSFSLSPPHYLIKVNVIHSKLDLEGDQNSSEFSFNFG
ncbi:hypothetical protein RV01_GL001600 [Enterococcus dispar]|nr:hypothetical protein RV01_GL001600 [Enterococcus dispar]